MTTELKASLADHAAGNYRVMMNLADELLTVAADRDLPRLDEKLYGRDLSFSPDVRSAQNEKCTGSLPAIVQAMKQHVQALGPGTAASAKLSAAAQGAPPGVAPGGPGVGSGRPGRGAPSAASSGAAHAGGGAGWVVARAR